MPEVCVEGSFQLSDSPESRCGVSPSNLAVSQFTTAPSSRLFQPCYLPTAGPMPMAGMPRKREPKVASRNAVPQGRIAVDRYHDAGLLRIPPIPSGIIEGNCA